MQAAESHEFPGEWFGSMDGVGPDGEWPGPFGVLLREIVTRGCPPAPCPGRGGWVS